MEAVILAAGLGSRLGHHTASLPKTMLEVCSKCEKRIIDNILETLKANNVRRVVIVTGYKGRRLRKYLKENYDLEFVFTHNHAYRDVNNIYSFYLGLKHVQDDFYLINSDVLFHPKIFSFKDRCFKILVDDQKKLGEEEMKVVVEGNKVVRISKEIEPEIANSEYIGVAMIPKEHKDKLLRYSKLLLKIRGNYFYEESFQLFVSSGGEIFCESTKGLPWIEVDTPHDLAVAKKICESFCECRN